MDMLVKELKEELEARDQRAISAQDRQQGMAAPWRLHARDWREIACARAHLAREPYREHGDFYRFVTWVKLLPF